MTSSSKQLIELALSFSAHGEVDERPDSLILRGAFASDAEQERWMTLLDQDISPFSNLQIYDRDVAGDLDAAETYSPERKLVITFQKPKADGVAVFVFSSGATSYLRGGTPAPKLMCVQLEPRASFKARGLDLSPWIPDEPIAAAAIPVAIKVRAYVRDYVPAREVAEDLSPWILVTAPAVESDEYRAWKALAARRLMGALLSTASEENGVTWLQSSGPPTVRIRADLDMTTALTWLTNSATWVFLSGADVEARHLIFAAEFARAFKKGQPLSEVTMQALQSAKSTYEAHVQSASRETLRALGELRKTVIEESQKVTQRAQDLASGLWRDVAISTAPFVLKVVSDATKSGSPAVTGWFYIAAAMFVLTSFTIQTSINRSYLNNQRSARSQWLETLYIYISADERRRIAEDPITTAEYSYETTKTKIGFIYLLLVLVLVGFGISAWLGEAMGAGEKRAHSAVIAPLQAKP